MEGERGRLYTYRHTVTTRMIHALRWAAMRDILIGFIIMRDKVTRRCPQTTTFEMKGEPKQIRTEVPLLTSLTPYRWAKPAHKWESWLGFHYHLLALQGPGLGARGGDFVASRSQEVHRATEALTGVKISAISILISVVSVLLTSFSLGSENDWQACA